MAYLMFYEDLGGGTIEISVRGLSQPVPDYYGFRLWASGWNGGSKTLYLATALGDVHYSDGYSTSRFEVSGLPAGTYTMYGEARPRVDTTWYALDSMSITVSGSAVILPPPTFSIYDYDDTTIVLNVGSVSGATSYGVYIDGTWLKDVNSGLQIIDGLTPGVEYQIQMTSYNIDTDKEGDKSSSKYQIMDYPYPNVTILEVYATEADIIWNSVVGATRYYVYLNGVSQGYVTGRAFFFTNLLPNTTYSCYVEAYNGTTYSKGFMMVLTEFKTLKGRPNDWSWEYTIASGQPFYSQSGTTVYIMRASHWNAFTSRINEFRVYKGLTNYSFTSALTSHTETQIKNCINQAITAINAMGSFNLASVTSGNDVKASTFTNMRDILNSL